MKRTIFITVCVIVAFYLFAYFCCSINPEKTYSWYAGIWHGLFWFPNIVMSLFSDSIYAKAPNGTVAYNIFYYATAIIAYVVVPTIKNALKSIDINNS